MNLWLRCLWVFAAGFFKKRLGLLEESCLSFRVLPNDLDLYLHMNNGRYLTLMDLGRIDLILRSALGRAAQKQGWNPLVGSILMRYRRPLQMWDLFTLKTRILGWDEKWFYIEQRFEKDGELAALGFVKGLFKGPSGVVPIQELLNAAGEAIASPEIPPKVQKWAETERMP